MGAFQALLLAVSLGWSIVLAEPQRGPPDFTADATYTDDHPHPSGPPGASGHGGPHMPSHVGPGSMPASIPSTHAHSQPPMSQYPSSGPSSWPSTATTPPTHPTGPPPNHPTGPPTNTPWHHPSPSPSPQPSPTSSAAGTTSGGLIIDTGPVPTAIKTYFVNGRPVIAGSPGTVIRGTTYSLAASAGTTQFYANGQRTSVSNAIIGSPTRTETPAPVPSATGGMRGGTAAAASSAVPGEGSAVRVGVSAGGMVGMVMLVMGVL